MTDETLQASIRDWSTVDAQLEAQIKGLQSTQKTVRTVIAKLKAQAGQWEYPTCAGSLAVLETVGIAPAKVA